MAKKITLTEQDIRTLVNSVTTKLLESFGFPNASRRDVRQIIISNIMAKHPRFRNNKDLAWAYYTMKHQGDREGEVNDVPTELIQGVQEALQQEKEDWAQLQRMMKERQEIVDREYQAWKSDPKNLEQFKVTFQIDPSELETMEGAEEAYQRFLEYRQSRNSWTEKTFTTSDGNDFNARFRDPNSWEHNEELKKIGNMLENKTLELERQWGLEHYPERIFYCANDFDGDIPQKIKEREDLAMADKKAVWFHPYTTWRCWVEGYCPKYNFGYCVDSSD